MVEARISRAVVGSEREHPRFLAAPQPRRQKLARYLRPPERAADFAPHQDFADLALGGAGQKHQALPGVCPPEREPARDGGLAEVVGPAPVDLRMITDGERDLLLLRPRIDVEDVTAEPER